MATIGQQLLAPDTGWKRIDDTNANISYSPQVAASNSSWISMCYNRTAHNMPGLRTGKALFNFVGTKLRIISYMGNGINDSEFEVLIDGAAHKATNSNAVGNYQMLSFEKIGLYNKEHTVVVTQVATGQFVFDAIDIDETGEIKPYDPWVSKTKANIGSMQIGDRINFEYTALTTRQVGTFANLGSATKTEIPVASSATPDGKAYFIHAGYDLRGRMKLVCDRNIQHSISWDTINAAGLVDGVEVNIGGIKGTMRLMTGGTSSSDKDNEWDNIIVSSTLNGTIVAGDNAVWKWSVRHSLTSTRYSAQGVIRGNSVNGWYYVDTSVTNTTSSCFRPIILLDPNPNILLYKKSGVVYNQAGTVISEPLTEAAFTTYGTSSITSIPSGSEVLCYTSKSEVPIITYSGYPSQSVFIPKSLVSTPPDQTLTKITAEGSDSLRYLYTSDLSTYYYWNGTTLVSTTPADYANYMTAATLAAIPAASLSSAFALAILTPNATDFSLDAIKLQTVGAQPFSVEIAGNEVSPLSTNSERTIPITSIPLGTSDMVLKAGDVTATVPITREAIARQSVKRSIKSYEGGYQGTAPVSNVEIHTPLVSTPSFANPWGTSKQWFGDRISTGIKGVQKISSAVSGLSSGFQRYTMKSNKVRKIEVK